MLNTPSRLARIIGLGKDVFISHCREDGAAYAQALHDELTARGPKRLSCYLDKNELVPGGPLTAELRKALRRCTVLVVVATPGALKSEWVTREIRLYLDSRSDDPRLIRIAFPSAPLPQDHPHFEVLRDTLAIDESPASLASEDPEMPSAVDGIRLNFTAARKRRRRSIATSVTALVLVAATWIALAKDRAHRASLWRDRAQSAEEELRFAEGEVMFAEAFRIAGDELDSQGYRRCRAKREFEHAFRLGIEEGESVVAVLPGHDGPLVVLSTDATGRLDLCGEQGRRPLLPANGQEVLESSTAAAFGWLAARSGDRIVLTQATMKAHAKRREFAVPVGFRDLELYPTTAAWLVEHEKHFAIEQTSLVEGQATPHTIKIDQQGSSTAYAQLTTGAPGAILAGDFPTPDGTGFVPYVYRWRQGEETWLHPFMRRAAIIPQVFSAAASPLGHVICIGLSPPNTASPITGLKDNRERASYVYARLDNGHFRDFEIERSSLTAALPDTGTIDAYYLTGAGELKLIPTPPLIVNAIDKQTLMTDVVDFAPWPRPNEAGVVFIQSSGMLGVARGLSIQSRRPAAATTSEIHASRDGEFVALVEESAVTVLRRASQNPATTVPAIESIEQVSGIRLSDLK